MILGNKSRTRLTISASAVTASGETSLDFQGINAATIMKVDAIKHSPHSKGTGCVRPESLVKEVNKHVLLQVPTAT